MRDWIKGGARHAFSWLFHLQARRILGTIYALAVRERLADGSIRWPVRSTASGRFTILVLTPSEFRGDPRALASDYRTRVLELPDHWLTRLMYQFYPADVPRKRQFQRYLAPPQGTPEETGKRQYRRFLERFLPCFYGWLDVDCVVGHHVLYSPDIDWGAVSDNLAVPYFVIHREGVSGGPESFEFQTFLGELMPIGEYTFEGSQMFVQNDLVRELFIAGGLLTPDQITVLGTLRMDSFLNRIERVGDPTNCEDRRKRLVLFPFVVGGVTLEEPVLEVFSDVHETVAKVALENPEIDVLIKPKGPERWFRAWKAQADSAFSHCGIDPESIPNLEMRWDLDPHDVILTSDVICGLNSTTLLEAGVAGKSVIIPYFGALCDDTYDRRIYLKEELDKFDVARSKDELEGLILARLAEPSVPQDVLGPRRALFERYVSNLDGRVTERCVDSMICHANGMTGPRRKTAEILATSVGEEMRSF